MTDKPKFALKCDIEIVWGHDTDTETRASSGLYERDIEVFDSEEEAEAAWEHLTPDAECPRLVPCTECGDTDCASHPSNARCPNCHSEVISEPGRLHCTRCMWNKADEDPVPLTKEEQRRREVDELGQEVCKGQVLKDENDG